MNAAVSIATLREKPILFSAPMVRAILAGRKTVTRRIVKLTPDEVYYCDPDDFRGQGTAHFGVRDGDWEDHRNVRPIRCPYGAPGDRLWVRETWARLTGNGHRIVYRADGEDPRTGWDDVPPERRPKMTWEPSIFMRRNASRITLEVEDVRVERLHDISDDDAKLEGVDRFFERFTSIGREQCLTTGERAADAEYRAAFAVLWDEINGDRANWKSNPWVWRVAFRVATPGRAAAKSGGGT